MAKVIGIQFQKNGKLYYFDANGFEPKTGDYVIVDTARGNDLGEVTMGAREIDEETWRGPLKKTMRIARQNIVFALGVKILILILGALGFANMWAAVFADVGVAVIAILNAMRTMR